MRITVIETGRQLKGCLAYEDILFALASAVPGRPHRRNGPRTRRPRPALRLLLPRGQAGSVGQAGGAPASSRTTRIISPGSKGLVR